MEVGGPGGKNDVSWIGGEAPSYLTSTHIRTPGSWLKSLPSVRVYGGGNLVEVIGLSFKGRTGSNGKRGKIRDFSYQSRWRLMKRIAMIDRKKAGLPAFLTLTYPTEWDKDWRVWKQNLNSFLHALNRKWPDVWGLWRLEFQKRGAPHFHFMLWEGPKIDMMCIFDEETYERLKAQGKVYMNGEKLPEKYIVRQTKRNKETWKWVEETWLRVRGGKELSYTRLEHICTENGVFYLGKYLMKLPEGNFIPVDFTGRFWGTVGKDRWKVDLREEVLPEQQWYDLRRIFNSIRLRNGGKNVTLDENTSISVFVDPHEANRVINYVVENPKCDGRRAPF